MTHDARYAYACRLMLLAGAAIHWVGAAILLMNHMDTTSTWRYAPPAIRGIALQILQALTAA